MTQAYYELWVRHYDTFSEGEFELEATATDKRILQDIIDSMGWGSYGEIRGDAPADDYITNLADISYEDFQRDWIISYGRAYRRSSDVGKHLAMQEEESKKYQAEREAIRALPPKGRKLP